MSSQNKSQTVELTHYQFIRFSGPDVRKFLQGQLSCNMERLTPAQSLRGAICNLKGRVVADVRVLQVQEDCLLQVSASMGNIVITTLSKYAVFSKVKLEIQDSHPAPFGLLGPLDSQIAATFGELPAAQDAVVQTAAASLIRVAGHNPRYELWYHNKPAAQTFRQAIPASELGPLAAWQRAELQAGIVHVDSTTTEMYTPQLLNYDISGVIDFKKGCYTGQEVVARMFYRGIAKKRMYLATTDVPLSVDDKVHQDGEAENKVSEILAFNNAPKGSDAGNLLATVLGTEAVESGCRFTLADQPEAVLTILPLEY